MKILCWNVNGIRAAAKKGFTDWFRDMDGDVVCLQETKAFPDQLSEGLRSPDGYESIWHNGEKPGYAG
ncbi:MAG: endonuclease/exonuclease/phosphatase family protein, partial [Spirochaetota bacterium]|nr:endonuclease/exonuclease/phosphatase family protein [Spirochaetota bacterium]